MHFKGWTVKYIKNTKIENLELSKFPQFFNSVVVVAVMVAAITMMADGTQLK